MKRTILRRTLALALCLAMLASVMPAISAADYDGWTSFTADFSQQDHEICHMAMGCLYGIGEEDVPTSNLLTPIRPYTFEQKAPDGLQHPNADAVLTAKTFLESGGRWIEVGCPDIKANWYYEESPFQSAANYALYKRQLREMAEKCVEAGLSGHCVYNIFNETDDGSNTWNVANDVWFAAWKDFVETIRAVDPLARFSGPGFANHNMNFLRAWIPWCIENDCAPFQVTLHCLTDGRYNSMDSDIATVRSICDQAGLQDYEICANEYAHHQNLGNPAGLIKYVATLEDNRASGCLAYWHVGNALDDLAADANEPNGAWWMYKMYADMSGKTVKCSTSTSKMNLYGLASIDEGKKTAYALFGGDHQGDEVLYMKGLNKTEAFAESKFALVTLRTTAYSGTYGPSLGPDLFYRRVLPIVDGTVSIPAEGALATNVFYATAIPVEKDSDPAEVEGPWRAVYEGEAAQRAGGASTVSSNTNYPASGGSLASLPNTGASLTFSVSVPKESFYELRFVYGMDTGSNPNNMNSHAPRMGKLDVTIDGDEENVETIVLDNTLQQLTCDNVTLPLNPILTEGQHTIKIQPNAESAGFPIVDCLYVTEKNVPTAESEDRVFEAEEASFNVLGGLKSSPVRIERAKEGFQGTGYVTGLGMKVHQGAGIRFAVCVKDNGYYNLTLRYRSQSDETVGLYLRNTALSLYHKVKDVTIPASDEWATIDAMLYLEKGMNLVDLDASSNDLQLDNITVRANVTAGSNTTTVQAEDCELTGAVETARSEFASGGTYVKGMAGSADASNKLTLKVTPMLYGFLPLGAGKYQLDIYYSDNELFGNHGTNVALVDRYFTMSVNGGRPQNICFRNTYSGDCFRVKTVTVELQAGENVIEFWNDDSREYRRSQGGTIVLKNYAPNVDKFAVSPVTTPLAFAEHEHETVLRDYKAPTCISPGFSGDKVCKLCGATVETGTEIPAKGHALVHHEAQAPGCLVEGWKEYDTCENCSYTTYEALEPVGHDFDEGIVTLEPTTTAFGVRTFTCRRCGETKTKKIPPIGYELPADIDFTSAEDADAYEIVGRTGAQLTGDGLVIRTTRNAVEPCNGQNSGDQANTAEDLIRYPLLNVVPWAATLEFDFDPSANNGYYQFFGFYAAEGEDYQNMCGIRGGDGALQDFLRVGGEITADTDGVKSSPGLASAGTYWFRIEWDGDSSYICYRSSDGENFTEMFRYENTGIDPEYIVIDAYTGMTEGYTFTLKSLTFEGTGNVPVDKSALVKAIEDAEKIEKDKYTDESVAALEKALEDAMAVGEDADQAAVDAAADALNAAIDALEEKPVIEPPFLFEDVKDKSTFYFDPVYWAYEHTPQITKGTDDTHFGPENPCTRGHVVTFLWRAAGEPAPKSTKTPFSDLKAGAFYEKAVAWAVEEGITRGQTDTTFGPDATCTRGQIVTFLWRFKGEPAPASTTTQFTDVNPGGYYMNAVAWAVEKKITKGLTETTFGPEATCSRGQVVTFLYRATQD